MQVRTANGRENYFQKFQCVIIILGPIFVSKNNLLEKALKSPFLQPFLLTEIKTNMFLPWKKYYYWYISSLPFLIDVNWLSISRIITKKKRSAVDDWVILTVGKRSFTESSKQDDCYLGLLKVRYRSSHFLIFCKALSKNLCNC